MIDQKKLKAYLDDLVNYMGQKILNHTPQLYLMPNVTEQPEPFASSFLIQYKGQPLLISAGHVFEKEKVEDFKIYVDKTNVASISGDAYIAKIEEGYHISDGLDLALFKLSDECAEDLSAKFNFFDISDVDYSQVDMTKQNLIVGYPFRKTKIKKHARNMISAPFILNTKESTEDKYKAQGLNPEHHLVFDYDQKQIFRDNKQIIGPDPKGVSGCGIWNYECKLVKDFDELFYAPIGVTTYQDRKVKAISGFNIYVIKYFLSKKLGLK